MISIVISSANENLLNQVKQNIAQTIGVPFEIIAIDNSAGTKGICQVYNEGTQKAAYDLICYMHEDIELLTPNWGLIVNRIFETNKQLGALGVAGCGYKTAAPSGWMCYWNPAIVHQNLLQSYKYESRPTEHIYANPQNQTLARVAALDGVWMCTRREAALAYKFDEEMLKGFHSYDIDFCIAISDQYQCAVTFEVLLRHFSEGKFDKTWLDTTLLVARKWKHRLPVQAADLSRGEMNKLEMQTCKFFISHMVEAGFSFKSIAQMLLGLKGQYNFLGVFKLLNYARKVLRMPAS